MPIITWIGLGFVIAAVYFMRREHRIILESVITEARVVELVQKGTSKTGAVECAPKAGFTTQDGEEIVFDMAASIRPKVKIGDPVRIAYPREHPERVRILSFKHRYGFWYFVVSAGLLFLFIGGGLKIGNDWMRKAYVPAPAAAGAGPVR